MSLRRIPTAVRRSLAVALLAGTALGAGLSTYPADAANGNSSAAIAPAPVAGLPGSFAGLVEHVSPAVVTITAARAAEMPDRIARELPPQMEEFLRRFGMPGVPGLPEGGPRGEQARSLGSGFVIDADGYVVTNRHVIEGADDVTVTFADGTERAATIVGQDDRTDLAVLKVEADKPLPHLTFGDSDKMRPGDWVIAVGNPFGLGGTVTAGIVSARGRAISNNAYDDYIQIDASINRGNSGGPTFNAAGEVIGINTAIFSPNGGSVGIGFAIPANLAKPVIEQLKATGRVERGWLGVSLQGLTPDLAEGLGLKEDKGALIASVNPDSPAEEAGLKAGDVVRTVDGQAVEDTRALARAVGSVAPGTELEMKVWREGREHTIEVAVGAPPGSEQAALPGRGGAEADVAGLKLSRLDQRWRQRLSLADDAEGVVVTEVDRTLEQLRPGDVIETVNGQSVTDPKQVGEAVKEAEKQGRRNALLLVRRGEARSFVPLPLKRAEG
ncbi:DegQ family serine endoprotease [Indioceanicola profundi]|uniref:DegQ family serine endoprotease n=1 Tax=Indioceanicola profundi TaxID=2220096 RepID=UPI000E6AA7C9|nr:DegQ family serine endoprotease [Indioceanicola profundi]